MTTIAVLKCCINIEHRSLQSTDGGSMDKKWADGQVMVGQWIVGLVDGYLRWSDELVYEG